MSFEYIQRTYRVPAKRGGRILYKGQPGTILATKGPYLRIRLDGQGYVGNYHPTWKIDYLGPDGRVIWRSKDEGENLGSAVP